MTQHLDSSYFASHRIAILVSYYAPEATENNAIAGLMILCLSLPFFDSSLLLGVVCCSWSQRAYSHLFPHGLHTVHKVSFFQSRFR